MLLLILFTSCTKTPYVQISEEVQLASDLSEKIFLTDNLQSEPECLLKVLNYNDYHGFSSDDNAAYFIRPVPDKYQPKSTDSYFYAIAYTLDFNNAVMHPICRTDNCVHSSPKCTAWTQVLSIPMKLLVSSEKLFWVSMYGRPEMDFIIDANRVHNEEICAYIDVSDLDGGNKKRLYTASSGDTIDSKKFFFDGTNLSFLENSNTIGTDTKCLFTTIEIETGEKICQVVLPNGTGVVGIYNNMPAFSLNMFYLEEIKLNLFTVNPVSGEISDCTSQLLAEKNNSIRVSWSNWMYPLILYVNSENHKVTLVDYETGYEQLTCVLPNETLEIVDFSLHEDYIFIMCKVDFQEEYVSYKLRIESGEIEEFSMLTFKGFFGSLESSRIIAETEKEYLIAVDAREYMVESAIQYIDAVNGRGNRYVYAMILKDNYLNGIAEYVEVVLTP